MNEYIALGYLKTAQLTPSETVTILHIMSFARKVVRTRNSTLFLMLPQKPILAQV